MIWFDDVKSNLKYFLRFTWVLDILKLDPATTESAKKKNKVKPQNSLNYVDKTRIKKSEKQKLPIHITYFNSISLVGIVNPPIHHRPTECDCASTVFTLIARDTCVILCEHSVSTRGALWRSLHVWWSAEAPITEVWFSVTCFLFSKDFS